jgi:hypothetical protein
MGEALDRGTFGEQGAGFYLGAEGYYFVDGPSGTAGHGANAAGFDGIAFNPTTRDLIIYDNKTYSRTGNIGSATAIDPERNLVKNLDALITKVQGMTDLPDQRIILDKLGATRASVAAGTVAPPQGVRIAVTNFGSKTKGVSGPLGGRGIEHIDMMSGAPKVPPPEAYIDREAILGTVTRLPLVDHAYMRRMAKGEAVAMAVATIVQGLADWSVQHAMNRETESWAKAILAAQSRGNGALLIYAVAATHIDIMVSRRLSYVSMIEAKSAREAFNRWNREARLEQGFGPMTEMEYSFRWIEPITRH